MKIFPLLAKPSARPGKTQLINHFLINNNWFLVDLPGYGYAKVSKSHRREFAKLIKAYFTKRKQLICAFVLIDIRHSAQKNDLEFMAWLNELGIAFYIVFTKSDKLKGDQIQTTVANYNKELQDYGWIECPKTLIASSFFCKFINSTKIMQFQPTPCDYTSPYGFASST